MNILDEIKTDASALGLLKDWLGEGGKPVFRELAEHRSQSCLSGNNGKACEFNVQPGWWERIKTEIALAIRGQLALKNKMDLFLRGEEKLGMCKICGCCNRLKPWVPIEHVKNHTSIDTLKKYPAFCWQATEMGNA